ncbi:MAG TPA: SUF system Fe-S cluster assembly protein [Gallionellaceae bacterium]
MVDFKKLEQDLQEKAADPDTLKAHVIEMLRTIYDPEIPLNIYDLGLIYALDVNAAGVVHVRMTLTTPNCPVAEGFPDIVQNKLWRVDGVSEVEVELVWDPPWDQTRMSEAARLQLGLM